MISPCQTVFVIFGWRMIFRNGPFVNTGHIWLYMIVPFEVSLGVVIIESSFWALCIKDPMRMHCIGSVGHVFEVNFKSISNFTLDNRAQQTQFRRMRYLLCECGICESTVEHLAINSSYPVRSWYSELGSITAAWGNIIGQYINYVPTVLTFRW